MLQGLLMMNSEDDEIRKTIVNDTAVQNHLPKKT